MSTKTPNFNLLKPELTDAADITKYNTNWDIIDENLGKGNGIPKVIATSTDGVEYTGTVKDVTNLTIGLAVIFIPEITSTSVNTTFNLNSLGSKSILRKTSSGYSTRVNGGLKNWLYKNTPVLLMYDGSYWIAMEQTKPEVNDLYGTVPIEKGGTGGITAEQARDNLGVTEAINRLKENVESSYIPTSEKGAANGVATLGQDGKVPTIQLPSVDSFKVELTSYSGSGTSGERGKTSIGPFSFEPKVVFVLSHLTTAFFPMWRTSGTERQTIVHFPYKTSVTPGDNNSYHIPIKYNIVKKANGSYYLQAFNVLDGGDAAEFQFNGSETAYTAIAIG